MQIFGFKFGKDSKKNYPINTKDLPVGQQSINYEENVSDSLVSAVFGTAIVPSFYPFEILDMINQLCVLNPDMANATDNIIRLGNTGHSIEIFGNENEAVAFKDELDDFAARIYSIGAGIDGLINDLLAQICKTGALSLEWVVSPGLDDLDKAVIVPVKTIRFIRKDGNYIPVQTTAYTPFVHKEFIELNPNTYNYFSIERMEGCPYAVPPFISALENVGIQKDVIKQLKLIARKYGFTGFLQVLISAPSMKPNETDEAYKARCSKYLEQAANRLKGSYSNGIAVGFKDVQEFKHTPVAATSAGVKDLFQLNEEQIASGVRQDPAMLGRTYSTTETYAGVVFEKMLCQTYNYQRIIKRSLEHGTMLYSRLRGHSFTKISFKFNESNLVNKLQKAQALQIEISNANALYEAGIINQNQRAQKLGYNEPALEASRNELSPPQISDAFQKLQEKSAKYGDLYPALILQSKRTGGYEIAEKKLRVF